MSTESALEEAKREAKAGNKRRAREILREAAKRDPRNEEIFLLFAQVAEKRSHAIQTLQHVLKINPNNITAQRWLDKLQPPIPDEIPLPAESVDQPQPFQDFPVSESRNEAHDFRTAERPELSMQAAQSYRTRSYIGQNLMPGERVIYEAKRHWAIWFFPALLTAILGLLSIIAFRHASHTDRIYVCSCLTPFALLVAVGPIWRAISLYFSTEFVLTNRRILHKVGILRRKSLELVLNHVEGVAVDHPTLGRIFGYGTLVITGTGGTKQPFHFIADPQEFRKRVHAQLTRSR
jgi:hypothetical protein